MEEMISWQEWLLSPVAQEDRELVKGPGREPTGLGNGNARPPCVVVDRERTSGR